MAVSVTDVPPGKRVARRTCGSPCREPFTAVVNVYVLRRIADAGAQQDRVEHALVDDRARAAVEERETIRCCSGCTPLSQ